MSDTSDPRISAMLAAALHVKAKHATPGVIPLAVRLYAKACAGTPLSPPTPVAPRSTENGT